MAKKIDMKSLFFLITIDALSLVAKTDALASPAPQKKAGAARTPPSTIAFKHLYRHYDDVSFDSFLRCMEPEEFLQSVGYTETDLNDMVKDYPALLSQNVHAQLAPKVQFLVHNLQGGNGRLMWVDDDETAKETPQTNTTSTTTTTAGDNIESADECQVFHEDDDGRYHTHSMRVSEEVKSFIPTALFFGCRLDRSVGPRHAYLQYYNLPHGNALWKNCKEEERNKGDQQLLTQFLQTCHSKSSSAADFAALCNQWRDKSSSIISSSNSGINGNLKASQEQQQQQHQQQTSHTAEQVQAFEQTFGPGLIPCAKADESKERFHPEAMIHLLLTHGANYAERDHLGRSPLHWAAGTGKVAATQALLKHAMSESGQSAAVDVLLQDVEYKDGATPFHWACCGIRPGKIGYGGSYDVCRLLLESCNNDCPDQRCGELANAKTFSNSTPLMWAAWAGSLAIVDLLAIHKADPLVVDSKGATVAHWAAAGGHVQVCQYLHDNLEVDFVAPLDKNGKSPLDIALEYDRQDVVDWIRQTYSRHDAQQDAETTSPSAGQLQL